MAIFTDQETQDQAQWAFGTVEQWQQAVREAVVITPEKLRLILITFLARGHLLIEDVPGLGKTMIAKALARSVQADFRRIQCTPDLLPGDITGGSIYDQREQRFEFMPGPIFGHVVLVDEINRASPRTQSSLLEAMAEGQVSSDGQTRPLPDPFFIMATQNPVEMAGTFPLPEAQLDRFLTRLTLGYPEFDREVEILAREAHEDPLLAIKPAVSLSEINTLQKMVRQIGCVRALQEYMVRLTKATRTHPEVLIGVSPRGGVALQRASQAMALVRGRDFVTPDDIKSAAPAVLAHRLMTRDRQIETAHTVISEVLDEVPVPVG
ncbi:MAG: MoxR family ATPase [Ardenticatenaceae bacterium]|nr:MoxR family ATPase [Ardenticatenaceae bacterium]